MSTPIDINEPPQDLDALLQSAMPELEALEPNRFVRRMVSRGRALGLTNTTVASWAAMVELLDEELSPERAKQRKDELARLKLRAWTFYAADLASEELYANTLVEQRRELARSVAEHDRLLFKWATTLLGDDPKHAKVLRDISRGTGARDDAEDVLRLVLLFRANLEPVLAVQQVVTEAYLAQAEADATRQIDALNNGVTNPARKLADATYSLWYHDYEELMQLGRYLSRREADSRQRFPGVRELPTRGSWEVESDDELEEAADDEIGADAEPPAEDPDAAA